jgi:multidrug efflux pump subunit AcrA (membrane-fusion protein)
MRKLKLVWLALVCLAVLPLKADEGMWLLQLMQEQHLIDRMKAQGLTLDAADIYNPDGISLKDAVGIFGGGCTGEIISPDGLILTNHHCGFGAIQQHSSVEHDYLTDGFWAKNRSEELATPGLKFTFVERILDVTDDINARVKAGEVKEIDTFGREFMQKYADDALAASDLNGQAGIRAQALPFYAGNRFYLFFMKVYSDVRMVAAPPQSIGKFGGETDNWMWPRHTCDFSMFRIYADKDGNPADYSADNVPLKVKKFLPISLRGIEDGDYAMIMGFPGSTSRFLTRSEVEQRMHATNDPRIRIRGARQDVLKTEMAASAKVRIQYASKYASSSNYWKNSIGMNKAIIDNKVLETKSEQEAKFAEFARQNGNADYAQVVSQIDTAVAQENPLLYAMTCFSETFRAIEFGTPSDLMYKLKDALNAKDQAAVSQLTADLRAQYERLHNKDYDHEVDRKVAKALLPLYREMAEAQYQPAFYETIDKTYKGSVDAYVDALYDNSIFASEANLEKFLKKPTVKAIDADLATAYVAAQREVAKTLREQLQAAPDVTLLHKTYVRGLCEMYVPEAKSPDANFTLRLTYGNVKAYDPKDGVHYNHYTTLRGVMEKEDPSNPEFVVPAKLKELYERKDYGRYAMADGEMPACFLTTNDITGGNSGSPVINGQGQLIGAAFDGNWESLSGDINFDADLQRCIAVDIRYILFIVDKLGGCGHLIDEMTIVE